MPDPENPRPRSKYAYLLDDKDVKRWYDNIARGSPAAAEIYLRNLGNFCQTNKITPRKLASKRPSAIENLLMDYVSAVQGKHAGSYIHNTIKVIKSWLAHNGIELKRKIKITGAHETPTLKDERVPTKDELRRIFLSAGKQARVACALIAHGGLRLETIGNYHADDGLRIRDLPELKLKANQISFEKMPTMIIIRPSLSKARHQYFTFLTEEACGYLKDYLDERLLDGEKLTPDSAIVTPRFAQKPFIRTVNVGDMIRLPIRGAGLPWRPYVLRSYFDTELMLAESKGLVLRDYRTFWMGHKGDIENRYTTNKHRLPDSVIEDMREAYKRSQDYLQTTKPEAREDEINQALKKQLLAVAGFSEEEVAKQDLAKMSNEELHNLVRQRLVGVMANNGSRQKVVPISEVERFLSEGYEYVASIPNDRAIIKIPF
jgi:hypothetical protein